MTERRKEEPGKKPHRMLVLSRVADGAVINTLFRFAR